LGDDQKAASAALLSRLAAAATFFEAVT